MNRLPFEPELLISDTDKFIKKHGNDRIIVQQKHDGVRCLFNITDGEIRMFSRSGKRYHAFERMIMKTYKDETRWDGLKHWWYDCEITPRNEENRSLITGKGHSKKIEINPDDVCITIFNARGVIEDVIHKYVDYEDCFEDITTDIPAFFKSFPCEVRVAPIYQRLDGITNDDIVRLKRAASDNKWEGFVLRVDTGEYHCGRTHYNCKVKPDNYMLMNVIDVEYRNFEKRGLYNVVARIECFNPKGNFRCWVGSGLTDELRQKIDSCVKNSGTMEAVIKYECISSTGKSLNHPRILSILFEDEV